MAKTRIWKLKIKNKKLKIKNKIPVTKREEYLLDSEENIYEF